MVVDYSLYLNVIFLSVGNDQRFDFKLETKNETLWLNPVKSEVKSLYVNI